MASSAPERSLRPLSREQGEERGATRRARERYRDTDMRALGNLEMRADMDRYLRDDPLARLGFDPDRVDVFSPYAEVSSAFYAPEGANLRNAGLHMSTLQAYNAMYPERELRVPEDTLVMNDTRPPAVLAHESRHRGLELLRRAGRGVDPMDAWYEESLVEIGDKPYLDEASNLPRTNIAFESGARKTAPVSWGYEHPNPSAGIQRYETAMQELAQDELTRRGEPPRTVRREPEPELSGVRRLLNSIFGGD